jgi:hypothetical protein
MLENLNEIRDQIYKIWNYFNKARGEWNDGYTQGLRDAMGIIDDSIIREQRKTSKKSSGYKNHPVSLLKKYDN